MGWGPLPEAVHSGTNKQTYTHSGKLSTMPGFFGMDNDWPNHSSEMLTMCPLYVTQFSFFSVANDKLSS